MDTALIAPVGNLEWAHGSTTHLCLHAEFDKGDARYNEFYERVGRIGDRVILDNGAHPSDGGQATDIQSLVLRGRQFNVSEVVFPDFPAHATATLNMLTRSLDTLEHSDLDYDGLEFMFVPQAEELAEWQGCLKTGYELCRESGITPSIGVAKHHDDTLEGGVYAAIETVLTEIPRCDVHMLGWPRRARSLIDVGRDFGDQVRSIDSAKPFVYAKLNSRIDEEDKYFQRDAEYFEDPVPLDYFDTLAHNVRLFERWARGVE